MERRDAQSWGKKIVKENIKRNMISNLLIQTTDHKDPATNYLYFRKKRVMTRDQKYITNSVNTREANLSQFPLAQRVAELQPPDQRQHLPLDEQVSLVCCS